MTKTDWTAEEVLMHRNLMHHEGTHAFELMTLLAERIAAEEAAVPVAWVADLVPGIERPKDYMGIFTPYKSYADDLAKHNYYAITPLFTHPPAQPAQPAQPAVHPIQRMEGPFAGGGIVHQTAQPAQETPCSLNEALNVIEHWGRRGNTLNGDDVNRFRALADKIAPAQEQPGGKWVPVESGWLIEEWNSWRDDYLARWWALGSDDDDDEAVGVWTNDSASALRFARKIDAEAYINEAGWTEAKPTEHSWTLTSPTPPKEN